MEVNQPVEKPETRIPADTLQERMGIVLRNIGIPPRPSILVEINKEMEKDEPDFRRLAEVVGADVSLSAGVIKVANSPLFGMGKRVRSVADALLVLGLRMAMNTVAASSLQSAFPHVPNLERFWDSATRSARVSRWLALHLGKSVHVSPDDAYTCGLFHDCGIPVLMIPFPEYAGVLKQANAEHERCFTDVEDDALSINHAIVGAELAEDWLLPDEITLTIRHHHNPAALDGQDSTAAKASLSVTVHKLIAVIQLAECLIQRATGLSQTAEWEKHGAACLQTLGLTDDALKALEDESRSVVMAEL